MSGTKTDSLNAEVVSVFPNKIKIAVKDLKSFKIASEKLTVGSYLKVSDSDDCFLVAIIENFSIEVLESKDGTSSKSYMIDAMPFGFVDAEGTFIRGGNNIAIPPTGVTPATKEEIQKIYDDIDADKRFCFSRLVQDSSIEVPVDGNKFFNKHIAIVGSTGSGKSHTVAKLFQDAIELKEGGFSELNNSHIIIFDIHSEYGTAFPKANKIGVEELILPYWLMDSEELQDLLIESSEEQSHNQVSLLKEAIITYKKEAFKGSDVEKNNIKYDSPIYFDINEVLSYIKRKNEEMIPGAGGKEKQHPNFGKFTNFISRLENKVGDKRLDFLFGEKCKTDNADSVIRTILSYNKTKEANITILDLSGVPFEVLSLTVSLISRIVFEYGYYYKKELSSSADKTPFVLVFEEAHKYVPKTNTAKFTNSKNSIERIAKEGRKYGVTAVIVSQRPSEISETIFSQCSNFIAMRLTNPDDQNYVKRLLPDTLGPLTDSLSILKAGEALLIGDSTVIPSIVKINQATPEPASSDISYMSEWKKKWVDVDFPKIISTWQK